MNGTTTKSYLNEPEIPLSARVLVLVSAACNSWYGYSQGRYDYDGVLLDGLVWVAFFCAADWEKPKAVVECLNAIDQKDTKRAAVSGLKVVFCVTLSVLSALGFAGTMKGGKADDLQSVIDRHKSETKKRDEAEEKLKAIGEVRAVAAIKADIVPANLNRKKNKGWVWKDSAACTLKLENYATSCAPIQDLRQELATAEDAKQWRDKRDKARSWLAKNKKPGSADPQADAIAMVLSADAGDVRLWIVIFLGLCLEYLATSAYVNSRQISAVPQSPPPPANRPVTPIAAPQAAIKPAMVSLPREAGLTALYEALLRQAGGVGGTLETTQGALADELARSKSRINDWLKKLAARSLIALEPHARGTIIRVLA